MKTRYRNGLLLVIITAVMSLSGCNIFSVLRPSAFPIGVAGYIARGKEEMKKGNSGNKNDDDEGARYWFRKAITEYPSSTEARLLYAQAVSNANLGGILYFFHKFFDEGMSFDNLIPLLSDQKKELVKWTFKPIVEVLQPIADGKVKINGTTHIMDTEVSPYDVNMNISLVTAYMFRVFVLIFDSNFNGKLNESGSGGDLFIAGDGEMFKLNQDVLDDFKRVATSDMPTQAPTDIPGWSDPTAEGRAVRRQWYAETHELINQSLRKVVLITDITQNAEKKSDGLVASTDVKNCLSAVKRLTSSLSGETVSKEVLSMFELVGSTFDIISNLADTGVKGLDVAHKALYGGPLFSSGEKLSNYFDQTPINHIYTVSDPVYSVDVPQTSGTHDGNMYVSLVTSSGIAGTIDIEDISSFEDILGDEGIDLDDFDFGDLSEFGF